MEVFVTVKVLLLTGFVVLGYANAVHAADPALLAPADTTEQSSEGWTFNFAPYFWAAGLSGDAAQFGLPVVSIDASFSDVLENFDIGFMAAGEARYGPYSIFGDIIYAKLGADGDTPSGLLAESVDVTSTTFSGLLGVGYSVIDAGDVGHLDLVGGVKVWSVSTEISFSGGILGGRDVEDDATWVDAMAGVRGNYHFTPEIYLTGWALIGGGGADLDWDVALGLGYKFNDTVSAIAGYRALGVDYSQDGFIFDVVQKGPILGMAIRF
ncbi:hypothetical protein [Pseudorhizobium xiangyangii]|uniref:hypothetical protein n=1 Tax=Pseudorhizobium xiangyangii TaxID=2883104 RepID=UPI0036F3DC0D